MFRFRFRQRDCQGLKTVGRFPGTVLDKASYEIQARFDTSWDKTDLR